MEKVILIHGSGHKAASWKETVSYLDCREDILCPELSSLLMGKEASYPNLRAAFAAYCAQAGGPDMGGQQPGGNNGGEQYYDAAYEVVDDDKK